MSGRVARPLAGMTAGVLLALGGAPARAEPAQAKAPKEGKTAQAKTPKEGKTGGSTGAGPADSRPASDTAASRPGGTKTAEPADLDAALVELNAAGVRLYSEGEYAEALQSFSEAYALHPAASLLFNIASCLEKQGKTDEALAGYRRFLDAASEEDPGRARAKARLQALAPMERVSPVSPQATSRPRVAPKLASTRAAQPREPQGASPRGPARWYVLGSGIGVSALSATLYSLGRADHREVTRAVADQSVGASIDMTRSQAESLIRSGDTKKRVAAVGAGVGALLIGGFAYLQLSGDANGPVVVSGFADGTGGGLSYRREF